MNGMKLFIEYPLRKYSRIFHSVLLTICTRISFYSSGQRRPPFTLRCKKSSSLRWRLTCFYQKKENILIANSCSLPTTYNDQQNKDKQTNIEPARREKPRGKNNYPPFQQINPNQYKLYLWPYSIKWDIWRTFILFSSISLIGMWQSEWSAWLIVIIFVIQICILPFATYALFAIPVLEEIWPKWPEKPMEGWLNGLISYGMFSYTYINHPKIRTIWDTIKCYLPPIWTKCDPTWFMPNGNPKLSLVRLAISTFFSRDDIGKVSRGIPLRWFFYWLMPAWGSLVVVVTISVYLGIKHLKYNNLNHIDIILYFLSAITWVIYSIMYISREMKRFPVWFSSSYNDELYLPPAARLQLPLDANLVENISSYEHLTKLISIITSITTIILLALGGVIISFIPVERFKIIFTFWI